MHFIVSMRKTTYLAHQAKSYGMLLRQSLEFLMLAVSYTLWSNCITTKWLTVVEQAHEIQALAKELEHFLCLLPDKFVAGGIIAKLPPF